MPKENVMRPVQVSTPQFTPAQTLPPEQMERGDYGTVPLTHRYPEVRGGTCEWCGVVDARNRSTFQYRLCDHFKNMAPLACSYCPEDRDQVEQTRSHTFNIYDHPTARDQYGRPTKIVVCSATDCVEKHHKRFKVS